jgi:hypothetical protein
MGLKKTAFVFLFLISFIFSEEIFLTPKEKEVKVTIEEPLNLTFNLPNVKYAKLYFLARAGDESIQKPAGYADALIIEINEKKITEPTKLINKSPVFRLKGKPEKEILWYSNNSWMIPISPDYNSVDNHWLYSIENTKACEFIFDITDFVFKGENKLKLIRLSRPWSKIPLYFKDVKIIYEKNGEKSTKKEDEISKLIAENIRINPEETKVLLLPDKEENKKTFLKITVRRNCEVLGGYGYYMQILVNENFVDASIDRKTKRLFNKSFSFKRPGREEEVFWNLGDGIWLTFFSPDFNTDTSSYTGKEKEPYTYLLDITDLLKEKGQNYLYIKNLYSKIKEIEYKTELPLYAKVEIIQKNIEKEEKKEEKIQLKGKPKLKILENGGIKIDFENTYILLESIFSYPYGGFNKLGKEKSKDNEKEWKVDIKKNTSLEGEIFGKGKYYSIDRKVKLTSESILIEDSIKNLTSEDIGIIFSNYINFENLPIYYTRMAGLTSQSLNFYNCPENPTIFYPLKNSGIGIVANDDVYRNHGLLFYDLDKKITGIEDRNFCLGPKSKYRISWSVYFVQSEDYYDFINLVRKDWGSNIKIEGPIYFINYRSIVDFTDEDLKKLIDDKNAKYIVFWEVRTQNPVPEYDNRKVVALGPGIFDLIFKEEIEKIKEAIQKLRRIKPDLKISLYTHSFFICPEKPDDPTYKDSWIVGRDGKRAISQYNRKEYYDYQPVFPTLNNSYGKAYMKVMNWYLNDMGFDWIYWDESTGPGILVEDNKTYNFWDGYSAIINIETKNIEKKFAVLGLVCDEFIMNIYEKVKRKGGFILFNGAAVTKSRIKCPSFVESQDLILRLCNTHLNTPLAYGFGKPSMKELIDRLNYGTIYARTHLDYQSDIVTKFYPITIEEIHSGWVKGKERIITSKSGNFGWDGKYRAKIYMYNENGEYINQNPLIKIYEGKIKIDVPPGGIVIIERIE